MRLKREEIEKMKKAFQSVLAKEEVLHHREVLRKDERVKDLEKRLRWDCFWVVKRNSLEITEMLQKLDKDRDFNDTHLDTGLKRVIKELGWGVEGEEG